MVGGWKCLVPGSDVGWKPECPVLTSHVLLHVISEPRPRMVTASADSSLRLWELKTPLPAAQDEGSSNGGERCGETGNGVLENEDEARRMRGGSERMEWEHLVTLCPHTQAIRGCASFWLSAPDCRERI